MLAVELAEEDPTPLALLEEEGGLRAILGAGGVEREFAERWLTRAAPRRAARPAPVATRVLCLDNRVESLACAYAGALGAVVEEVAPAGLERAVLEAEGVDSVTVFLLADRLEERLLHSLWLANRQRVEAGRPSLPFGFLSALTPSHLGWLVTKTLAWLSRRDPPARIGFADYDGFENEGSFRLLAGGEQVDAERPLADGDWSSEATDVAALLTHSVSFDAHLGATALCGQMPGLEKLQRSGGAPSCFFDGVCFRTDGSPGSPRRALPAISASPLVWFLNGCGAVPLAGSAFGVRTGYAYGLLAGAAIAVMGAHVTQVTNRRRNGLFGGLLATGMTTGEAALALSQMAEDDGGFHSYPLLGSPDLRLSAEEPLGPASSLDGAVRYEPRGTSRWALRLRLPQELQRPPVLTGDDGGDRWNGAACQVFEGRESSTLVTFEPPRPLGGWLELKADNDEDASLAAEAEGLRRRLGVLGLYEFAAREREGIETCEAILERLLQVLAEKTALRRRIYAAALLAGLELELDSLQRVVCERFVEQVLSRDFNLDRESYNGFVPGVVRRTAAECSACGSILFAAADRWSRDRRFTRTKHLCANCFGVSMALDADPLQAAPLGLDQASREEVVLALRLRNLSRTPKRIWTAAAPRRGGAGTGIGPFQIDLAAGGSTEKSLRFDPRAQLPGTQSFRAIVIADGAAQFQNFKLTPP